MMIMRKRIAWWMMLSRITPHPPKRYLSSLIFVSLLLSAISCTAYVPAVEFRSYMSKDLVAAWTIFAHVLSFFLCFIGVIDIGISSTLRHDCGGANIIVLLSFRLALAYHSFHFR